MIVTQCNNLIESGGGTGPMKPDNLQKVWVLRKFLYDMDELEAMEFLLDKLKSTKTNDEFFELMKR